MPPWLPSCNAFLEHLRLFLTTVHANNVRSWGPAVVLIVWWFVGAVLSIRLLNARSFFCVLVALLTLVDVYGSLLYLLFDSGTALIVGLMSLIVAIGVYAFSS